MKIKPDDKNRLFNLLDDRLEMVGRDTIMHHKALKLGEDVAKRFRWDLLYASKIVIGDGVGIIGDVNLYQYMNDSHIDTALKLYVADRF